MNTNNIKKYAPQARREFIAAVGKRLNQFGIYADSKDKLSISEAIVSGSVLQIDGNSFDTKLAPARARLVNRAEQMGFEQLAEHVAYTWFNRLCAIRFMELKSDYLEHGLRVLSHPAKATGFEVLDHAQDVAEQLGLDRNHIVELKLAGNKDEELYRYLLLGQCHKLHEAMQFLFEALDDETELLLPDNLTRTDSILRGLVDSIPENEWQHVEIIGWLYQFYISEKKDQVIGNVVKSEDIPAATQLFTPNWIVKYLVQNSVGRQWLMTYPDSGLKAQMDYYIEPAEQEPSVVEALAAITPTSITPETIKVLDPACGSGHILVEAYDILKAIYEERGYRVRDIPKLILEKNLYGLDIDDRAAQLAGFALMMKAREDDRRIFSRDIKLNVLAIQSSQHLDVTDLWHRLALNKNITPGLTDSIFDDVQTNLAQTIDDIEFKNLRSVLALFEQAKILGSLIQVPNDKAEFLRDLKGQLQTLTEQGDSFQRLAAKTLLPFVHQAWLLAQQYDAVVANPPYMGGKGMNAALKEFAKKQFPDSKSDLFAMFIERGFGFLGVRNEGLGTNDEKKLARFGFNAQVTMQSWMFLSSYEVMREKLLSNKTLNTMAHLGARAFSEISGEVVQTTAFVFYGDCFSGYKPTFFRLVDGLEEQKKTSLRTGQNRFSSIIQDNFKKVPGSPVAYWVSDKVINLFQNRSFENYASIRQGMATTDNERFLRKWYELAFKSIGFNFSSPSEGNSAGHNWFPYNKGGEYRKWYGNFEYVVNFEKNGEVLIELVRNKYPKISDPEFVIKNRSYYCHEAITWSDVASGATSFRFVPKGMIFDGRGSCIFPYDIKIDQTISFLNSPITLLAASLLNPTLVLNPGEIKKVPFIEIDESAANGNYAKSMISIAKNDWDSYETSWDFTQNLLTCLKQNTVKAAFEEWKRQNRLNILEMQRLEQENNRLYIEAYGLQDELIPEVPEDQITLARADQEKDIQRLISYAVGCMMGRYSLDEPSLIYAHAGNVDFDTSRYPSFPADEDGILPLTDQEWFKDDATNRFREFLIAVWGEDTLQQNLDFIAESLTLSGFKPKKGETSLDTVRRYLSCQFYKDHLQTYKKRPIYWLFSSGKQKAFECLVYLHRYNESTLARMRTEYVTPLLGKYSAYAEQLNQQLQDASSSEATRIKKEQQTLEKKQAELRQFDDKLKHYADMRVKLDLDDGVKVNYGKFGDLLADVKAVTGGKE
jgi:type II restriction/modification system DNA methylase subunit YeeA